MPISSFGRSATATDRSSERTDKIVRREIQDALRAVEGRSDTINVGKMMKISLPEYHGGESIEAYLKFLREFLVYLINYNLMKHEADAHRVSLLSSALKEKALRWYQHTIHLNADGLWTFELAMIELKRYFVKDVSSHNAAIRFNRISQANRTVTELKKDLERLSQLMIETPSDYDMGRRFLNALKPEIASMVVQHGINSKNSNLEAIFEVAKSVEQGMFYEEIQQDEHWHTKLSREQPARQHNKIKTAAKAPCSGSYKKPDSAMPVKGAKDYKTASKPVECYTCKWKGHYSNECPRKIAAKRMANIEMLGDEEDEEVQANTADGEQAGSEEDELFTDEEDEPDQEGSSESDNKGSELLLNDWTCATRILFESDNNEDDYIVYSKPYTANGADLQDWSQMARYLNIEEISGVEDYADNTQPDDEANPVCIAARLIEEEEFVKSAKVNDSSTEQVAYQQQGTKDIGPLRLEDGPRHDFKRLGVIEGYMRINGHRAHVLLDGGSTLDMISANFATVQKLDMFQLKKPIKLQMATSGSRSVINYRAKAELHVGELKEQRYFDVVNLDRYNVILGTPFLKQHEVTLNYAGHGSFKLKGRWFLVQDSEFGNPLSKEGEKADKPAQDVKNTKEPTGSMGKGNSKPAPDKRTH
ncbi:hypothetical protein AX14_001294 [Amanita brunnescens Koide BX004]|nr:hypothetical protein AX14_001294 [Amanita brunnescens Koide BX004]